MITFVPHAAPTLQTMTPSVHDCHVDECSPTVTENAHAAATPAMSSAIQIIRPFYQEERRRG